METHVPVQPAAPSVRPEPKIVLLTGASSGIGALTVRRLAARGHTVYAGMRAMVGPDAPPVEQLRAEARAEGWRVRAVHLDVTSEEVVTEGVRSVLDEAGQLDVVIHNAGHMVIGPAEAFTAEEVARIFDVNVLGAHRVNRAVLPHLRGRQSGLLVWVGSSSTRGGHTPFIAPYFAAKAALDSLAVDYADELIRFGIETTIVVPGAFATGTRHFDDAGFPVDQERVAAYNSRYGTFMQEIRPKLAALAPPGADVSDVATEITRVVELPSGNRPFRTHVDPNRNGSEVVSAVADRIRADFYRRLGIDDLLPARASL